MAETYIDYKKTPAERKFETYYFNLINYFNNIAINIFEWKRKNGEPLTTLSEGLTSPLMEDLLFNFGNSIFIKDENLGHLNLKVVAASGLNVYFKPVHFRAIGNGYNKEYDVDNSVIIKNNSLMIPTIDLIAPLVAKMADIELTIDLRRDAHKTPYAFETTEDTLLSSKNYFKKIHSCEPAIFKNKTRGEGENGAKVIDNRVEYINDKLLDEYNSYEARILTILGLDNYVEDKKERVQSAEVDSQQEYIISSFRSALLERQKACEAINKMFGLDLVVDYVKGKQIEADEEIEETEETEEVVDNG